MRSLRHDFARTFTVAVALALTACAAEESGDAAGSTTHLVSAADIAALAPDGELRVDLRDRSAVWVFDQTSGALAFERITLVCPDANVMGMESWVGVTSSLADVPLVERPFFAIGASDVEAVSNALARVDAAGRAREMSDCGDSATCGACTESCWRCSDGAWVCTYSCPDGTTGRETRDPRDTPGPSAPETEPRTSPAATPTPASPPPPYAPPTPTPPPR